MSNIAVIDPNARPNLVAGVKPMAIVPQTMDEAYRLAKAVCAAGMAPRGLDTPEKAMVAVLHGLELGLTPMAALQRIAVVNGRPTIWGDGAMALVRGSGACEYVKETIAGEGDKRTALCEAKRRGEPVPITRSFSVSDAKKAGLWAKQGPWQQFPDRMLQMRARAFCLRDGFADVLGGLYLKEELDDGDNGKTPPAPPVAVSAPALAAPTPVAPKLPPNPHAAPKQPPAPAAPKPSDGDSLIAQFEVALGECRDPDGCNEAWNEFVEPAIASLTEDDLDELQAMLRERVMQLEPVDP